MQTETGRPVQYIAWSQTTESWIIKPAVIIRVEKESVDILVLSSINTWEQNVRHEDFKEVGKSYWRHLPMKDGGQHTNELKISSNELKIIELKKENLELWKQEYLLCDGDQWFTEQEEEDPHADKRKKIKPKNLIGRRHWNEDFTDDSSGEVITIERSEVVRVNGVWL